MSLGRRQFTDEFKREAVALLVSSGRPLMQIAVELGIAPPMLRNWCGRGGWRDAGLALCPNTLVSTPHSVPTQRQRSLGLAARTIGGAWSATF
jgi:transposase-like protein